MMEDSLFIASYPKPLRTVIIILNSVVRQMLNAQGSSSPPRTVSKCFIRLADDPGACQHLYENIRRIY